MSREIKFRGLRVDGKGWVYGSLIQKKGYYAIVIFDKGHDAVYNAYLELQVIPESVGQFTGIIDKDDVDIYEGDKCIRDGDKDVYIVSWNQQQAQYWLMPLNNSVFDFPRQLSNGYLKLIKIKVVGNIHENKN